MQSSPQKVLKKDVVIFRLYFTFMDRDWANNTTDLQFLHCLADFMQTALSKQESLRDLLNPEKVFNMNESNKKKTKGLLVSL